jgi:transposase
MTDDECAYFELFLIRRGGRPPRNHRHVLDAVFWLMRTGAPWRDLPEEFGNWNSIFAGGGKGGPRATRSAVRAAASRPKSTPAPMPMVYRSLSRSRPARAMTSRLSGPDVNDIDCDPEKMLGDR